METDVTINNQGTIVLLTPCTEQAQGWIDEHIPKDAMYFGNGLVVEPRYVEDIIHGMIQDGLELAIA